MSPSDPLLQTQVDRSDEHQDFRVAIYARTSSKRQTQGYSLQAQIKRCVERSKKLGWRVEFVYRDEAESGADTDRPMFQQMLQTAKKGAFDVVMFWKLDRFSRSLMHAVKLEAELRESDVYLYSVTEQINTTTPTGRFNFRNIASAAEFERDMIRERTRVGLNELADQHKWPNNTPPLGYDLTSENRLSINEEEAQLVKNIFSWYTELRSMPDVAAKLNRQGISTRAGGEWTARAVGDILRNEIYRGQYELADVSTHVPEYQIIDMETFQKVTEIRTRFQSDHSKQSMPDTRKKQAIDRIKTEYQQYLQ